MFSLRFDRAIALSLTIPLWKKLRSQNEEFVPVLMYHSVSCDPEERISPYYRVATSPERFSDHMRWLSELGYTGVALEEILPLLISGKVDNRRLVAITFDDGFRDFHAAAWPVLQRYSFTATMYLPTGFISRMRKVFRGKECLTWHEVRELRRHGIRFASHTVNHSKLYELPWKEIENEMTISRKCLQQELQEEITGFAYPYAFPQEDVFFVQRFSELLRSEGYLHCATTAIGRAKAGDNQFLVKRLPVNSCDDRALFVAKLRGAYDWLGFVQSGFRALKRQNCRFKFN